MNKELQELTDVTIKEIRKLEIVLPEIYKDIFYTKAQELGITISASDKEMALIYALKKIQTLKHETEQSASILKENVSNAKIAIANNDTASLEIIEENIINLGKKITTLQNELYLDDLTHLYNRRWVYERFLKEDLFTSKGVLAFIDINDFKIVNDTYGHMVGDKVLVVLGKILKRVENTLAVRFAGDEFIIISEKHSVFELEKILETVNQNLRTTQLKHNEQTFYIDFSFGIEPFSINDAFKPTFESADRKMYLYKKSTQYK